MIQKERDGAPCVCGLGSIYHLCMKDCELELVLAFMCLQFDGIPHAESKIKEEFDFEF